MIAFATFTAIFFHAIFPGGEELDSVNFDGLIARNIGFQLTAILYFVLLFLHCVFVMQYFGKKADMSKIQIGLRFGIVFALIYFFGMQEVVVEASPFEKWGIDFVIFQFFMGLGDALPVLIICSVISIYSFQNKKNNFENKNMKKNEKIKMISLITIIFTILRGIGYETGLIVSNVETYRIQSYLWTIIFGVVIGLSYVLLYPVFLNEQKRIYRIFKILVLTIGTNWLIFNSFMGMIFKNTLPQMILRVGTDIVGIFLIVLLNELFTKKRKN
jgi:hypothetical protein